MRQTETSKHKRRMPHQAHQTDTFPQPMCPLPASPLGSYSGTRLRSRVQSHSPVSRIDQSQVDRYRLPATNLSRSSDSSVDESNSIRDVALIVEVRSENGQLADADEVTGVADDESLLLGEVGDTAAILEVLGVTVSDGGDDLVLDRLRHVLDGAVDEGCALAILVLLVMDAEEGGK